MSAERGKVVLLVVGGAAVAGVVLFVASRLDDVGSGERRTAQITDAVDLVNPSPLTERDRTTGTGITGQPLAELERGAWVEVSDSRGRLAQKYSAERVEPLPDRRLRLESPRANFYREDGRVITLSADRGEARVPSKALESGRLEGNVVIRVFRPEPGATVDLANDVPAITINAEDATFDNVLGEVRCDGAIDVVTTMGSFFGEGLDMRIGAPTDGAAGSDSLRKGTLERLVIERARKPIVLVRDAEGRTRLKDARSPAVPPSPAAPSPSPATPSASTPAAPAQVYRLTLHDDVRVVRERNGERSTLRGDALIARFTMEGEGTLNAITAVPESDTRLHIASVAGTADPASAVLAAAFAQVPQTPSGSNEETITIEYAGQLVLEPERDVALRSPDAVEVELVSVVPQPSSGGAPATLNRVTLDDERTQARVTCRRVTFSNARGETGDDDLIEAFGGPDDPLVLASPRLNARGERFFLKRTAGVGGFVGPGSVELASGGESFQAFVIDPSAALASAAAGDSLHLRVAREVRAPSSVAITWQSRLDLSFAKAEPAGDDGALELATFVGAVDVVGDGFELDAESLAATFDGTRKSDTSARALSRILAQGDADNVVVARRTDGVAGELRGDSLDLALVAEGDRDAVPARLVANGRVVGRDAKQAVYGEKLVADFVSDAGASTGQSGGSDNPTGDLGRDLSTVAVDGGNVETGLQVELFGTPSSRVFADRLDGDNANQTLNLAGRDIWLVRDLVVVDQLTNVHLEGATRSAVAKGPGRVRAFRTPFVLPSGPIPRPTIPTGVNADGSTAERLVVTWSEQFDFVEKDTATNGSVIELAGAVRVRNTPSRAATDAIDAAELRLELMESAETPFTGAAASPAASNAERASIRAVEARGDAVVESRQWASAARDGDPRLFKLGGDHLRYDTVSREGWVDGAGSLLTHVPLLTSDRTGNGESPSLDSVAAIGDPLSFGAEGTTQFKWGTRLDMLREAGDRYQILMRGAVEVMHKGPDRVGTETTGNAEKNTAIDWLAMTASEVDAWVTRATPSDNPTSEPAADNTPPMDLGGTARLDRVVVRGDATSRIYVRTNAFDLECDEIDFDVRTGMAAVSARPGSAAKVLDRKGSQPLQAEFLEWNLSTGQIVVKGARGSVGR